MKVKSTWLWAGLSAVVLAVAICRVRETLSVSRVMLGIIRVSLGIGYAY